MKGISVDHSLLADPKTPIVLPAPALEVLRRCKDRRTCYTLAKIEELYRKTPERY